MKSRRKIMIRQGIRLKRLAFAHRTNDPYISGDSIANLVDYVAYGKTGNSKIELLRLQQARSVFVVGHKLRELIENYGHTISCQVVVSGNSDQNIDHLPNFPQSVKLFISQNLTVAKQVSGVRTYPLPIGIENLRLGRSGSPALHKSRAYKGICHKVLVPPMSPTNAIRKEALREAKLRRDIYDVFETYLDHRAYFKLARGYRYVLCLEGNGYENHRIWETLYRNAFPVLLRSKWSERLMELELPILLIESIDSLNESTLSDFVSQWDAFNPRQEARLWTPYWEKLIKHPDEIVLRKFNNRGDSK